MINNSKVYMVICKMAKEFCIQFDLIYVYARYRTLCMNYIFAIYKLCSYTDTRKRDAVASRKFVSSTVNWIKSLQFNRSNITETDTKIIKTKYDIYQIQ